MAYTAVSEDGDTITVTTTVGINELQSVRNAKQGTDAVQSLLLDLETITRTFRLEVFGYKGSFGSPSGWRVSLISMAQPDDDVTVISHTGATLVEALTRAAVDAIDWLDANQ
jgi:hypothetical protein